jgi:translation elongation factor P/translation initiation factor 5A
METENKSAESLNLDDIVYDDRPWIVVELCKAVSAKRGKIRVWARLQMQSDSKVRKDVTYGTGDTVTVPAVVRKKYLVMAIDENGTIRCKDKHGQEYNHLVAPNKFKSKIVAGVKIKTNHCWDTEEIIDWSAF